MGGGGVYKLDSGVCLSSGGDIQYKLLIDSKQQKQQRPRRAPSIIIGSSKKVHRSVTPSARLMLDAI
jgi:hypothetical protein